MCELAIHYDQGPLQAKIIARSQGIPLQYLEQIFNRLKRSRLIKTLRGPKGGYSISKAPENIKVYDIVKALEGGYYITECTTGNKDRSCAKLDKCNIKMFWNKLDRSIYKILTTTTLAHLSKDAADQSRKNGVNHRYVFQI
jgi:Rrf2 family protein